MLGTRTELLCAACAEVICHLAINNNFTPLTTRAYMYSFADSTQPHAPLNTVMCRCENWAPAMWEAMKTADVNAPAVSWDAHWETNDTHVHRKTTDNSLEKILNVSSDTGKPPASHPSMFARL